MLSTFPMGLKSTNIWDDVRDGEAGGETTEMTSQGRYTAVRPSDGDEPARHDSSQERAAKHERLTRAEKRRHRTPQHD